MSHSLTPPATITVAVAPISTTTSSQNTLTYHRNLLLPRREMLGGVVFGLSIAIVGDTSADAAARRPPPPPPKEKKDPNVSGAVAKFLASKKRKEAMKESIAQLREQGKAITN